MSHGVGIAKVWMLGQRRIAVQRSWVQAGHSGGGRFRWLLRETTAPGRPVIAEFDDQDACRFWLRGNGFLPTNERPPADLPEHAMEAS